MSGTLLRNFPQFRADKTSWNAVTKTWRFYRPETGLFICKETFLETRNLPPQNRNQWFLEMRNLTPQNRNQWYLKTRNFIRNYELVVPNIRPETSRFRMFQIRKRIQIYNLNSILYFKKRKMLCMSLCRHAFDRTENLCDRVNRYNVNAGFKSPVNDNE